MYTKTYQELTFADDFMFCKILSSDSDLCKRLVELLLGVKVKEIKYKDTHHEISLNPQQKSVKLDVRLDYSDPCYRNAHCTGQTKQSMGGQLYDFTRILC